MSSAPSSTTLTPQQIFDYAWNTLESEQGKVQFPKEILWLNGSPGAGKGTHTKTIKKVKGYKTDSIEMSSLFKTSEIKAMMDKGILIDDKTTTLLLFRELTKPQYAEGVIMDGYPRTIPQADVVRLLAKKLAGKSLFQVIALMVGEQESVRRQTQRAGEDKAAGKPVRATDLDPELARKRYKTFMESSYAALESLASDFQFHSIETMGTIEEVGAKIAKTLK
jgi:adenylate kinase